MFLAYRAATLDIITEYLFGHCQNNLNYPDFGAPLLVDIQTSVPMLWLLKSFPFIIPVLPLIPRWVAPCIHDQFRAFCSLQEFLVSSLDRSMKEVNACSGFGLDHPTICHRLFEPSFHSPQVPFSKPPWLDEVLSLIQAGSDTVGNTCTVGTFFVLNEKRILLRLTEELRLVWPDSDECIDVAVLQALPYLVSFLSVWVHLKTVPTALQTAVIKEALRLSHGFVTPLPRVVGPLGAKIAGFEIPPKARSLLLI
jgi:hypothetical protein